MASPATRTPSSPAPPQERERLLNAADVADPITQNPALQAISPMLAPTKGSPTRAKVPLRKGKWTPEEEVYANRIIAFFNQGVLNIPAGTTLRSYLSERLNCDPMRITKKFAGASCIGKQVFSPCDQSSANSDEVHRCEEELRRLEKVFIERLEQKNAVAFDLREQMPTTDAQGNDSEWSKQSYPSAPRSSGRGKNSLSGSSDRRLSQGTNPALKKAISAPDLTQLAQLHEERKQLVPLGEEDPYTVDDKAAGDLLLEFFRKLHEDHAASVRAANAQVKQELPNATAGDTAQSAPHVHARKQRKVGFDDEATRKELTSHPPPAETQSKYEPGAVVEAAPHSACSSIHGLHMSGVPARDRDSFQHMYPPMYGAHALKRRRSSEPALDRLVAVDGAHHSWLSKLHPPHPLDEGGHNFHPHKHFS